jgi:regulator of protease activity HflC (stomatin/prohibitin superfamily)
MTATDAFLLVVGAGFLLLVLIGLSGLRIVAEYERAVIFRLGRVVGAKGPGLFFIIPVIDKMVKANLQTQTYDVPPQDIITKDNVTVRVNAVSYFNVMDPVKAIVNVQHYHYATSQVAQTTLRSVLGQYDLDELLTNRDEINQQLQSIIDKLTDPWGVKMTLVEVKDVELPESMRRAMARQAEAERERRAKVIHAQGEFEAAAALGEAAGVLERHPAAMQLRVLSTMVEVSAEKNSTLVFPVPIELLRLMDAATARLGGIASANPDSPEKNPIPPVPTPDAGPGAGTGAGASPPPYAAPGAHPPVGQAPTHMAADPYGQFDSPDPGAS